MAILESIFGGGAGKLIKDVVGTFHLSPEAQREFDLKMAENATNILKLDADLESKLQETAGQNIRAEAASGDKFTSRARPTFLYVVETILLWNYIVVPMFHQVPVELPEPLFWLFGSGFLGYTGARTWEKFAGKGVEK